MVPQPILNYALVNGFCTASGYNGPINLLGYLRGLSENCSSSKGAYNHLLTSKDVSILIPELMSNDYSIVWWTQPDRQAAMKSTFLTIAQSDLSAFQDCASNVAVSHEPILNDQTSTLLSNTICI